MGAVTGTVYEIAPNAGAKMVLVTTPSTTDTADTVVIVLESYGISAGGLQWINGCVQTTANSVIVTEAPTTSVTTGTLTITVGGSTVSDKVRAYMLVGTSK